MYIRPCYREKDGKRHAYWALVESYRTASGPRQRVVSYVGVIDDDEILDVTGSKQDDLFGKEGKRRKIEIDPDRVEVKRCRDFGGVWLGWELVRRLGLDEFVEQTMG